MGPILDALLGSEVITRVHKFQPVHCVMTSRRHGREVKRALPATKCSNQSFISQRVDRGARSPHGSQFKCQR